MSNFWSLIVFGALFTLLIVRLQAGSTDSYEFKTKPIQRLDDEVRHELLRSNRWGYSVMLFPELERHGYTYSLTQTIQLYGVRLKSIPEVEKLHATIYTEILSRLNSVRSIRPFLAEFPLSPDLFGLSIIFYDERGAQLPPPYFVSIIMHCGELEFNKTNGADVIRPFETVLKKAIGDSKELQGNYRYPIERKLCSEKPRVPEVSYILDGSRPHDYADFEFAKTFSEKNNLHFVGLGPVKSEFWEKTSFKFILYGNQKLKKDEARKLSVECANEFLKFVRNDKRVLDFMIKRSSDTYFKDDATIPESRHIGFRISFWDENIDRQPEPYIAEIRFYDGKFMYFIADDGQRLVLVHEESFDEAQAFLKSLSETPSR